MTLTQTQGILSDRMRCAPILQAMTDEQYDHFMVVGESIRMRDRKTECFRFIINDAKDIPELVCDIADLLHRFIVVDSDSEENWRMIFPEAEYKQFKMSVNMRKIPRSVLNKQLPDEIQIVPMDESWDELVIEMSACDEFPAESLKRQLRENLSLGLIWQGKRVGFHSKHLNGEMGPLWVSPEVRGKGFGMLLIQEYQQEHLKESKIAFALMDIDNHVSIKVTENLGIPIYKKNILQVTTRM